MSQKITNFDYLKDNGYIEYGKIIPDHVITMLLGCNPRDGWEFLGPFLHLKESIENQGYFCTSADCRPGSLRILALEQMADKVESIQKQIVRKQRRALTTMINSEAQDLSEYEKSKHALATTKLSLGLHAIKSVLYNVG